MKYIRIYVWLHSSVGRASHRCRGGHGFEFRRSPDFFRLLLSNCLNWKIYCDDHSSHSYNNNDDDDDSEDDDDNGKINRFSCLEMCCHTYVCYHVDNMVPRLQATVWSCCAGH